MDSTRFDTFTRSLTSRRSTLGRLAVGGVLAALGLQGGAREAAAAPCPKGKKRCKGRCIPKRACCTTAQCRPGVTGKVCQRGRCSCRSGAKPCQGQCIHPAAACPPQPAAACRPGGGSVSGYAWYLRAAQTFTEPNGGHLTAAALWMRKFLPTSVGTFELRVTSVDPGTGLPIGAPLAFAERPASEVSGTALDWVAFTFPTPPPLVPGRQYALVLTTRGGASLDDGYTLEHRTLDPCPGGFFSLANPDGPFGPRPETDIAYQTFVSP